MATLRKQNKGITGTMTDDKGNSTDFSVDDVIDSKKYKANVEKAGLLTPTSKGAPLSRKKVRTTEKSGSAIRWPLIMAGW